MFPLKDNIPTERFPVVTVALIVANVIVYLFLQDGFVGLPDGGAGGDWPISTYAYIPCTITGDTPCQTAPGGPENWVTVFTAMFMHGGLLHLGGNMLFLWIFGNNVEDSMGPVKFLAFYLLGGIAATALQTAINTDSDVANLGSYSDVTQPDCRGPGDPIIVRDLTCAVGVGEPCRRLLQQTCACVH